MADDDNLYFPTPTQARTISSLDEISGKNVGDIEVLVSVKGKSLKMKLKDFYKPWDVFIGQYMHCATNVYDFTTIVPCLGGIIYAEDFEYGLDTLGDRMPPELVFTDDNGGVTHIQLPDLRDRLLQFDPNLPYGFLEDEGVESNIIHQINTNNSLNNSEKVSFSPLNTSGNLQGHIKYSSSSFDTLSQNKYATGENWSPGASSVVVDITRNQRYVPSSYKDPGSWLEYSYGRNTRIDINQSIPLPLKYEVKSTNLDKNQFAIGQRTRERTVNAIIGMNTGPIKRTGKKTYWLVDELGKGLITSTAKIYLLGSTKNPGKGVGENTAIMTSTHPTEIQPALLQAMFFNNQYRQDPMGFTLRLDSKARNEGLKLSDYFTELSLKYALSHRNQEELPSILQFSSDESGRLILSTKENDANHVYKLKLKIEKYTVSTENEYNALFNVSELHIQQNSESEIKLDTIPSIWGEWFTRRDEIALHLGYTTQSGFTHEKLQTDAIYRSSSKVLGADFFHFLASKNTSQKEILEATLKSWGDVGIRNVYNPMNEQLFFFRMKKEAFLFNTTDQETLALEFQLNCFKEKIQSEIDFYNKFTTTPATNLSEYVDFDNNIFVMEGFKMKLFYDFSDGEHWIGFKRVFENGQEDKEYSLVFTKYNLPQKEANSPIPFVQIKNAQGGLEDKTVNLDVLKFTVKSDTRLALTEKPHKTKYDFLENNVTTPIIMVAKGKVLMMSIPHIDPHSIEAKIDAWTGTNFPKDDAKKAMENLPFFLYNITNIDNIDEKTAGKTGIFNQGNSNTRFYFRMK